MPDINIPRLDEDIAKPSYSINISTTDIKAATTITIPSSQADISLSNQGSNIVNNPNQTLTINAPTQDAGAKTTAVTVGTPANGGVLTTKNTKNLPNIFFNFRSKTVTDTSDLLFKFETSKLTVADFTGTKLSTWNANSDIRPNISLDAKDVNSPYTSGNFLSVVKAYDKYFYQLDRYKKISNVINLPVKTNPSYTIFVFGVGKQTVDINQAVVPQINTLHTFRDNNNNIFGSLNIGALNYQAPNPNKGSTAAYYNAVPTASFIGNTLNSNKYSDGDARIEYNNYINISNEYFYKGFGQSYEPSFNSFLSSKQISPQKYSPLGFSNIAQTPFVLNTKDTFGADVNINLNHFSLYFVEMFSYIDSSNQNYNTLRLQTFVNGLLTYDGGMQLKKTIPIDSFGDFKIELSNNYAGNNADSSIKLFLFDYLHGVSNSSVETMKQKSRNIVESLAYDYRNIILKSTTDIQLSNSSTNTSLSFKPVLIHPFLRLFFNAV